MLPKLGSNIGKLPRKLQFVRALEEFDGPILTELSAEKGGLYLEKWCAHDEETVRTLVVRTEQRAVAEYLACRISMLDLLTIPSDDVGFIVDQSGDEIGAVYMVRVSELPNNYLPKPTAYHDAKLRPEWEKSPQSFLLDADWDADLLAKIERLYADVFAFNLFTKPGSEHELPRYIFNCDYNRGFPIVHAFNGMRAAVPRELRAKSGGVSANSPGVLTIDAPSSTAAHVISAIESLQGSEKAYENVHAWSRLKPEKVDMMHSGAMDDLRRLCEALDVDIAKLFPGFESLQRTEPPDILVAGKLVAAYYRKLWTLLEPFEGVELLSVNVAKLREKPPQLVFEDMDGEDGEWI